MQRFESFTSHMLNLLCVSVTPVGCQFGERFVFGMQHEWRLPFTHSHLVIIYGGRSRGYRTPHGAIKRFGYLRVEYH